MPTFPTLAQLLGHNFDNVDGAGLDHRNWMAEVGAACAAPTLTGDLSTAAGVATVTGIQGQPVSVTHPLTGQALVWNGSAYVPTNPQLDLSAALLGQANGQPISPATIPPGYGPEMWTTANQNATGPYAPGGLTPTMTPSSNASATLKYVANLTQGLNDWCFRLSFNVATVFGTGTISLRMINPSNDTDISGCNKQKVYSFATTGANSTATVNYPFVMDFRIPPAGGTSCAIQILIEYSGYGGTASGTGTILVNNVSLRPVASYKVRPMLLGLTPFGGSASVHVPLYDVSADTWRLAVTQLNDGVHGSNAADYLDQVDYYSTDCPFSFSQAPPDPTFARTTQSSLASQSGLQFYPNATSFYRSARVNNDDQVLLVLKKDGVTYEYRGNTHGGELPTTWTIETDDGSGTWTTRTATSQLVPCRRVRNTFNTTIQRSAPDNDIFATTTHVATFFNDGVMRCDRTTTFTEDIRISQLFEWMSSHSTNSTQLGRMGTGLLVTDQIDTYSHVAVPVVSSVTPNNSTGSLPAATYSYALTAFASGGETTVSPTVTGTVTGGTSQNVIAWSAVTNATGYAVYRLFGNEFVRIALLGPAATSFTDDGTEAITGIKPPVSNEARILTANAADETTIFSDRASWAAWYHPEINMAFANIYDRDAVLNRTHVKAVEMRLQSTPTVVTKNYLTVGWVGDGNPNGVVETQLITAGTVWTATHWAVTYVPQDPRNYHFEAAVRATNLTVLKNLYPST